MAAARIATSRSRIGRQRLRVPPLAGILSSCHASPVVVSIRRVVRVPLSGSVPSWRAYLGDCEQDAHIRQRNNRRGRITKALAFFGWFLIQVWCNLYDVVRRRVWFNPAAGPGLPFLAWKPMRGPFVGGSGSSLTTALALTSAGDSIRVSPKYVSNALSTTWDRDNLADCAKASILSLNSIVMRVSSFAPLIVFTGQLSARFRHVSTCGG